MGSGFNDEPGPRGLDVTQELAIDPRPAPARGEAAPLEEVLDHVLQKFTPGATLPGEHPGLADFARNLRNDIPHHLLDRQLRSLSHAGFLRGALVVLAADLRQRPRPARALLLSRELLDAIDPALGIEVARALLTLPEVEGSRLEIGSTYTQIHMLLADVLHERGEPGQALRHFEAVLAADIDNPRALRGWRSCVRVLEQRGLSTHSNNRGLVVLDGLAEVELSRGFNLERYDLGRPLGRGRHAVVYQAHDRRTGRDVAIKRLLGDGKGRHSRVIEARFFAEARTLAGVRSPYVISLLDVVPQQRFIVLSLCRGGNLRHALRRQLIGPSDLPRVGTQLLAALRAVHAVQAIHRDIKPVNILVRQAKPGSAIALADFGLALRNTSGPTTQVGTLRYMAPELRTGRAQPSAMTDRVSAGIVLLELALYPQPLPDAFDKLEDFDPSEAVPDGLPDNWSSVLRMLLARDPAKRRQPIISK